MENLGKDVLSLLALELDYKDILKLCLSSQKLNSQLCKNNDFWKNKLRVDYPNINLDAVEPPIKDYKAFYNYVHRKIETTLLSTDVSNGGKSVGFLKLGYILPETIEFLKNANLGNFHNTNIPIYYYVESLISKGIASVSVLTQLFNFYLKNNGITEGVSRFYFFDENGKYISKILSQIEVDDPTFNRNRFSYNKIQKVIRKLIIPNDQLSPSQLSKLEDPELDTLNLKINKILSSIKN